MQESCVFCKIIKGDIPCVTLLDNKDILAFLDINPIRPGHALIVPKVHAPTILDLSPAYGEAVLSAMKTLGEAIMAATGAEGFNVIQNNFPASGQEVPHIHWHIIPRNVGDGIKMWPQGAYDSIGVMQDLAERIRSCYKQD